MIKNYFNRNTFLILLSFQILNICWVIFDFNLSGIESYLSSIMNDQIENWLDKYYDYQEMIFFSDLFRSDLVTNVT